MLFNNTFIRWAELCVVRCSVEGEREACITQAISLCDRGLELEPASAQLIRMRAEAHLRYDSWWIPPSRERLVMTPFRLFGGMAATEETIEKLDAVETAVCCEGNISNHFRLTVANSWLVWLKEKMRRH